RVPWICRAGGVVGSALREVRQFEWPSLEAAAAGFNASFLLGGQIGSESPRLFQVYPEGNFIEATNDTPYFQIGEHKYGKPIIDRVAQPNMRPRAAAKTGTVSL